MATRLSQYRSVGPALVEQRAAPRHRIIVSRSTKLHSRSEPPIEATLHDLSVYGCRLACSTGHREGERLFLGLKNDIPVAATVVWNDGDHRGCRFDAPIDRGLVRSLTLVIC